ncbi:chloramphenicol phosphotransferase CPT family protein [Paenibacillus wynnii]|uniref:chloramphenicol phosphotransferase CPT family protein n=1 Tax=Paenibacillus wynnii TaxID=268407 RepID=UPI00068E0B9D|nr:AAA family ATPase [Paenibacillus wynnii]
MFTHEPNYYKVNKGTVIFLNGTSSSGKTSISKELIRILEEDFMYLSVDHAISGVNDMLMNMFGEHITREEIRRIEDEEIIEKPVISLFHHYILAFSMAGKNIIVDHVLVDSKWLEECVQLLSDTRTFLIGVHCPINELERRERDRGDRPIGLASAQFTIVHENFQYDLEVNTHMNSVSECAVTIRDFIKTNEPSVLQTFHTEAKEPSQ